MPQMSIKCVVASSSSTADAPICIWDCRCGPSDCAARKDAQWTASCRENGILMHPAHGESIAAAQENSLAAVSASWCVWERTGNWIMMLHQGMSHRRRRRRQRQYGHMDVECHRGAAATGVATMPPKDVPICQGAGRTAFSFAWIIGKESPLLQRNPSPPSQPVGIRHRRCHQQDEHEDMDAELHLGVAGESRPRSAATAGAATCSSMRYDVDDELLP
ncbi:hypothetical protein ACLKA6_008522 [Drosophila palustris]